MRRFVHALVVPLVAAAALIGTGAAAHAAPPNPARHTSNGIQPPRQKPLPPNVNCPPNQQCTSTNGQPIQPAIGGTVGGDPTKGNDSCPLGGHSKVPPVPAMPGADGSGWLATQPAASAGTFDAATTTPDQLFGIYGLTSWEWHTYDLGCPTDPSNMSQSTIHRAVEFVSSLIQGINTLAAAIVAAILSAVLSPTWLGVLDPLISKVMGAFAPIFHSWVPLSIAVLGLMIVWRAAKGGAMRNTARDIGAALLILGITLTTIAAPTLLTSKVDSIIKTGTSSAALAVGATSGTHASTSDPASAIIGRFTGDILYTQWVQGLIGCTTCAAATHNNNAMHMFNGSHISLDEAKIINSGGDSDHHIEKAKAVEYASAAADVGKVSSDAYNNVQGSNNSRIMVGLLTAVSMIAAFTFLLAACLLVIVAFLTIRVLIMFLPLLALIGIVPAGRPQFKKAMDRGMHAIISALIFFAASVLNMVLVGVVMNPNIRLNGAMRIILCAAFSIILWSLLKPHRKVLHEIHKITKKVTDPVKDGAELAAGAVITGGAAAAGMYAADKASRHGQPADEDAAQPRGEAWLRHEPTAPEPAFALEQAGPPAIEMAEPTPNGEPDMPIDPIYTSADDPNLDVGDYAPVKQKIFRATPADQPEPEIVTVEDERGVHYDPAVKS